MEMTAKLAQFFLLPALFIIPASASLTLDRFVGSPGRMARQLFGRPLHLGQNSELVIGSPANRVLPPADAYFDVPLGNGRIIRVPKGVYSSSQVEKSFEGDLSLPNLRKPNLLSSLLQRLVGGKLGAGTKTTDSTGVYIPMPFGLKPVNVQLSKQDLDAFSNSGSIGTSLSRRLLPSPAQQVRQRRPSSSGRESNVAVSLLRLLKDATADGGGGSEDEAVLSGLQRRWKEVRQLCSQAQRQLCREALTAYRFYLRRKSQQEAATQGPLKAAGVRRLVNGVVGAMIPHLSEKKLLEENESASAVGGFSSPLGGLNNSRQKGESRGVYIDVPGMPVPIYVGGYVDNSSNSGFNVDLQPN